MPDLQIATKRSRDDLPGKVEVNFPTLYWELTAIGNRKNSDERDWGLFW